MFESVIISFVDLNIFGVPFNCYSIYYNNSINIMNMNMNVDLLRIAALLFSFILIAHQQYFPITVKAPPAPVNPNCTATGPNNNY